MAKPIMALHPNLRPLTSEEFDGRDRECARRLKTLLERNGFHLAHELTDNKHRDARIYRRLSFHVLEDLHLKINSNTFRAPLTAMFELARDAMAFDATSPAWATTEIVDGPFEPFLELLRENMPWRRCLRQGDFDILFKSLVMKRDLWYLYDCGAEITPAEMAARGAMAIAIDEFLDKCDARQNEWSLEFQRLSHNPRLLVAHAVSPELEVADTDTDQYMAELFKELDIEEGDDEDDMVID